jgi:hypothetical protein
MRETSRHRISHESTCGSFSKREFWREQGGEFIGSLMGR